jgi:hypothetical protein
MSAGGTPKERHGLRPWNKHLKLEHRQIVGCSETQYTLILMVKSVSHQYVGNLQRLANRVSWRAWEGANCEVSEVTFSLLSRLACASSPSTYQR